MECKYEDVYLVFLKINLYMLQKRENLQKHILNTNRMKQEKFI